MESLQRYSSEILAWEYDQRQPEPLPGELEWYLKYAQRSGSPILELFCGSGRLLIPIAQAGYEIHGVDSSQAMLNRLQEKLGILDKKLREKVKYHCCDVLDFIPKCQYAMAIIAYNSLQELETGDRIRRCFKNIYNILTINGYFLFTVRFIELSSFKGGEKLVFDSLNKPFLDEEKGLSVGSKLISHLESENRINNEHTYVIKQREYPSKTVNFVTYTPVLAKSEYIKMLEDSGFNVLVSDGYNEEHEDRTSKEICFACQKIA